MSRAWSLNISTSFMCSVEKLRKTLRIGGESGISLPAVRGKLDYGSARKKTQADCENLWVRAEDVERDKGLLQIWTSKTRQRSSAGRGC